MYVDYNLLMANSEDVYGSAGTSYADYSIDLKTTGVYSDIGKGRSAVLVVNVETAFAGTSGSYICFQLLADIDLTIDGSSRVVAQSGIYNVTELVAGTVIKVPIPAGSISLFGNTYDHIGVGVATSAQTSSAGTISAFIALE